MGRRVGERGTPHEFVASYTLWLVKVQAAVKEEDEVKPGSTITPAISAYKSHLPLVLLSYAKKKSTYHMMRAIRHSLRITISSF